MSEKIREFVLAGHGDLEKVKAIYAEAPELLDVPFDWGEQGGTETALEAASHVGNRPIAEFLLEKGAKYILVAAAMLGDEAGFNQFIAENPEAIHSNGAHGISLMFHAAMGNNLAILEKIYQAVGDKDLGTALIAAVSVGNLEATRWALEKNASTDGKDWRGRSLIEIAEAGENPEIIAMLKN